MLSRTRQMARTGIACITFACFSFAQGNRDVHAGNPGGSSGQQAELRQGLISGRLIDRLSREPIGGQTLALFSPAGSFPTVVTDSNGAFVFVKLPPGSYGIAPVPGSAVHSYGRKVEIAPGAEVVEDVIILASRTSDLAGVVLEGDGKTPAKATVLLVSPMQRDGRTEFFTRRTVTDEAGRFLFEKLEPGRVYVGAIPAAPEFAVHGSPPSPSVGERRVAFGSVRTFYPGAQSMETAIPIEIGSAVSQSNIVVQLIRARLLCVQTQIIGEDSSKSVDLVARLEQQLEPGLQIAAGDAKTGDWIEICGLSPGDYTLFINGSDGEHAELAGTSSFSLGALHSELPPILLHRLHPLTGKIEMAAESQPVTITNFGRIVLLPDNRSRHLTEALVAEIEPDGSFRFPAVARDAYRIAVKPPSGFFVSEVRQGTEVIGEKPVFGGGEALQIVFRNDAAAVGGVVHGQKRNEMREAGVWLIPEDTQARSFGAEVRVTSTDQHGRYLFESVKPGTYRLVAMSTSEIRYASEVKDPLLVEALARKGKELKLDANARQEVTLEVVQR